MIAFSNREAWLLAAVQLLKPIFAAKNTLFLTTAKSLADLPAPVHAATTSGSAGHGAAVPMTETKFSFPQPWETLFRF